MCLFLLSGYLYSELRTARHVTVFFVLAYAAASGTLRLKHPRFIVSFLLILFYGLVVSIPNTSLLTFKFFFLFVSPLLSAYVFSASLRSRQAEFIDFFFLASILFQAASIVLAGQGLMSLGLVQAIFSRGGSGALLVTSVSEIENSFGFIFGYYCIYYLNRRRYSYFLISFIFIVLNYKRVILIAFLVAVAYLLIFRGKNPKRVPLNWLITAGPFIILIFLILLGNGSLNKIIDSNFHISANQLTTGRYNIYHELSLRLFEAPRIFFGYGLGHASEHVRTFEFSRMTLVHSDYLMIMYDLGYFGFTLFFLLLKSHIATIFNKAVLMVFFLMVLIFDNTVIYFDVMFLFYLLILHEDQESNLVLDRQQT